MSQPLPFTYLPSALIPVYHWHGARPPMLDLDENQSGWSIWLLYTREGDCCLVPLSWLIETPGLADDPRASLTPLPCQIDPFDPEALALTLQFLQNDGWQLTGRLDFHFTGCYADSNFWSSLQPYLPPAHPLPNP